MQGLLGYHHLDANLTECENLEHCEEEFHIMPGGGNIPCQM